MRRPLSVRFWGVRGSIATGGTAFARVGGNTTCVEVRAGDQLIILDAGTGLYPLGQSLADPVHATFLLSHFHWDHIQGFPMFRPAYLPANTFTIFGAGDSDADVETVFSRQMQPPHFPVGLDALHARLTFRALRPGDEVTVGPVSIRAAALNHPQGCLGYRIGMGGSAVVFATDTEPLGSGAIDPAVVELARDADLLIHDAQYTEQEYHGSSGCSRRGWGHSTYEVACETAHLAGVKQLALFHHDPSHDDAFVERMVIGARSLFPNSIAACEGVTIQVGVDRERASRLAPARSLHAA